jgi:hypothetical protein
MSKVRVRIPLMSKVRVRIPPCQPTLEYTIMVDIYDGLYVGDDTDYEKIKSNSDWRSARMCKYGPDGHQQTLGYKSLSAPKGKNYLSAEKDNRLAVNILDLDDPQMIPFECIKIALDYIKEQLEKGKKVLVACNSGHSRGPSTGMAFLRSIGELPYHFIKSENIYKVLYPNYDPGIGIRQLLREHWGDLQDMEV